jgi:hypothetical protein
MTHEPELIAELAELRTRARAAAELLHAQHLGALTVREARRLESVLQRPIGKVSSIDAEAVLHIAFRIGSLT